MNEATYRLKGVQGTLIERPFDSKVGFFEERDEHPLVRKPVSVRDQATGQERAVGYVMEVDHCHFALKDNLAYMARDGEDFSLTSVLSLQDVRTYWENEYTGQDKRGLTILGPDERAETELRRSEEELCLTYRGRLWSKTLVEYRAQLDGEEAVDGEACSVVSWEEPQPGSPIVTVASKIWINPSRGYRVVKRLTQHINSATREVTIQEQAEVKELLLKEDVWFPTRVLKSWEDKVKQVSVISLRVGGIPEDLFQMRVPEGTRVWDNVQKREYFWRELGWADERIGKLAEQLGAAINGVDETVLLSKPPKGDVDYRYCGVHGLLLLCKLTGINTSSKELARLSDATDDGMTTFLGLQRAAIVKGLESTGMELTFAEWNKLNKPALILSREDPNHVLVAVKAGRGYLILVDPPTRVQVLTIDATEIDRFWSGKALVINRKGPAS